MTKNLAVGWKMDSVSVVEMERVFIFLMNLKHLCCLTGHTIFGYSRFNISGEELSFAAQDMIGNW